VRITALLPWFDETPADLTRAVSSFAPLVDHVVAVDGGYAAEPELGIVSPAEQEDAIKGAAAGLDLTIVRPAQAWGGEVAKLDHAVAVAAVRCDWFIHLHADYELAACDVRETRAELARTDAPQAWGMQHTPEHPTETRVSTVAYPPGSTLPAPLMYRGGLPWEVRRRHWLMQVGGHPAHSLPRHELHSLTFTHWVLHQSPERMRRKWEYVARRDTAAAMAGGIEP
jgi:hypothetical protein